jgi:hypothetical protein
MPRFLIEVQHENDYKGCVRALETIMQHGSHLTHKAEFGCADGVHTGWLIVDVESREDAQMIIPPQHRGDARIVQLKRWTREQIENMVKELES